MKIYLPQNAGQTGLHRHFSGHSSFGRLHATDRFLTAIGPLSNTIARLVYNFNLLFCLSAAQEQNH